MSHFDGPRKSIKDDTQVSFFARWRRRLSGLTRDLVRAPFLCRRDHCAVNNLETVCAFVGYSRSGHSLIGSLLDAHPEIAIAHEKGLFWLLYFRFGQSWLNALLLENSRQHARNGRQVGEYSYRVARQWQGRFTTLRVIGDKHGEAATLRLERRPWLLDRLRRTYNMPVRFIHVIRNPFDNISTICRKSPRRSHDESIDHYLHLNRAICQIRRQLEADELFELRHEAFLASPSGVLESICRFLGVTAPADYLRDCEEIVYKSPHRSRDRLDWDQQRIARVQRCIDTCDFLAGYTFES